MVGVLEAAKATPSVKAVVVTSSNVAAYWPSPNDGSISLDQYNDLAVKLAFELPDDDPTKFVAVYSATKVESERKLWQWVKENKVCYLSPNRCPADTGHSRHSPSTLYFPTSFLESPSIQHQESTRLRAGSSGYSKVRWRTILAWHSGRRPLGVSISRTRPPFTLVLSLMSIRMVRGSGLLVIPLEV